MAFPPNQYRGLAESSLQRENLYKRPDVEIKEIEVNLYLRVHRKANYLLGNMILVKLKLWELDII